MGSCKYRCLFDFNSNYILFIFMYADETMNYCQYYFAAANLYSVTIVFM